MWRLLRRWKKWLASLPRPTLTRVNTPFARGLRFELVVAQQPPPAPKLKLAPLHKVMPSVAAQRATSLAAAPALELSLPWPTDHDPKETKPETPAPQLKVVPAPPPNELPKPSNRPRPIPPSPQLLSAAAATVMMDEDDEDDLPPTYIRPANLRGFDGAPTLLGDDEPDATSVDPKAERREQIAAVRAALAGR